MQSQPVCIRDLEIFALQSLDKKVLGYYSGGADDEETLRENINSFKRIRIRPRMLIDVSIVDCSTTILGQKIAFPIGVAPTAMHKMAHPDGEMATAKATASIKTCFTLSSYSNTSMEDITETSENGLRWFQLYIWGDREISRDLVKRAEKSGYKALVVTVDLPVLGNRLAVARSGFKLPSHLTLPNFRETYRRLNRREMSDSEFNDYCSSAQEDKSLTWNCIDWLRSITSLPIVIKGILTAEDAKIAVAKGVDGIWVSNHGGRQLDGVPTAIEALPEIVDAVKNKAEIYADGGIRSGLDAFKAIALGAKVAFVGRPILWGLVYNGENGVRKVLQLLEEEFIRTMMLSGCTTVNDITSSLVAHVSTYSRI